MDAVQRADSGHPGTAMALAPVAYVLWHRGGICDTIPPTRLVGATASCCGRAACMLLYAALYLTGYISHSTTSSSSASGEPHAGALRARAHAWRRGDTGRSARAWQRRRDGARRGALAQLFNRPGHSVVDHHTYFSRRWRPDGGCVARGLLAGGHLKLGRLMDLRRQSHHHRRQDDITFSDDTRSGSRATAGTLSASPTATTWARSTRRSPRRRVADRPSLIIVRTHIAFGSPHKQDTPRLTAPRSAKTR